MKHFLFDITHIEFGNEKQLNELLRNFPSGSLLLVTREQKLLISGFGGNSVRYIDMSFEEIIDGKSITQDILVIDSVDGSYKFVTARALEKLKKLELTDEVTPHL